MLARLTHPSLVAAVYLLVVLLPPLRANALEAFDFEARYLVHEGNQIWDFCLEQHQGRYHIFYHTIPVSSVHPADADTIWHAVSDDLRIWEEARPVLTSGPEWWDEVAIWAPDVIYDEASKRWAMLYTGVGQNMVQRTCLAWSSDLHNWTKDDANPVFEPDSQTYFWSPDEPWSSFRDPFVYHRDGQWNMLNTAGLRVGEYPGTKQAIVHRSVSDDLVNWTDAGVFFAHDGETGRWRDFESVQYIERGGYHHIFFVEQDPSLETHSTSWISAADPSEWTMAERIIIDAGWAPEVTPINGWVFDTIFGRLHQYDNPHTGLTNVVVRFDQMTFGAGGRAPVIGIWDPLAALWPVRDGEVGFAAPTFGDNPVLRGEVSMRNEGHGWFSSYENYGGPLSGVGFPGDVLGDEATGGLTSKDFVIAGDYLRFRVAGGDFPETCYLALMDARTNEILLRTTGTGSAFMIEKTWDFRPFRGRDVRLRIQDKERRAGGWIALDSIHETMAGPASAVDELPAAVMRTTVHPNPFNPRTTVSFSLGRRARVQVAVYDLSGRRVQELAHRDFPAGEHRLDWDGRDAHGRTLPSGTYLIRLTDGVLDASRKVTLVQ